MIRRFFIAVTLVAMAYILGFAGFVWSLPKALPRAPRADGIVVLTGGDTRLDRADELLEQGMGKRLLVSGVDPATSKGTLERLIHAGPRFKCCADLGYAAEDTQGNARETADWVRAHHFRRLILVTSRYHMPRSLTEFAAALPDVQVLPYPVEQQRMDLEGWWRHPRTIELLHREYVKYLASLIGTSVARA